jgi:predicted flap endonuclease-1-like 5' DNA nuclease
MANLTVIEGIGLAYATKLAMIGVTSSAQLLEAGATPAGRRRLVESTNIDLDRIMRWTNMADLFRIKGIGEEYADLLEAAGVDTVPDLARRSPENLHEKLAVVNQAWNLVRRLPAASEVRRWVDQAKELPRIVVY